MGHGSLSFKALSRMSSFPTLVRKLGGLFDGPFQSAVAHELISNIETEDVANATSSFQSAVAHELISNVLRQHPLRRGLASFKALSRMSSFPTLRAKRLAQQRAEFQSAVAHELISNSWNPGRCSRCGGEFQSAVAHELISNRPNRSGLIMDKKGFKALSRMSSFPTPISLCGCISE